MTAFVPADTLPLCNVCPLLQNILGMMQVVCGNEVMQQANADAMNRLQTVADEADLALAGSDNDD